MVIKHRKIWLVFHRWIGIVIGLIIAVLGVTGSILVFESEIDSSLNPQLLQAQPGATRLSFDAIVQAAADAYPGWTPRYFERLSDDPTASFKVIIRDASLAEKQVFENPYTGAVLGERSGLSPIAIVRRIHGDLVLGEPGENIVGVLSLLCLGFFIAGIVLWWPAKGGFRRALTLSGSNSEPKRLMRELHNVFGAWLAVFFVIASRTVPPLVWKFISPGEGGGPPAGGPPRAAGGPSAQGGPPAPTTTETPPTEIAWQAAAEIAAKEVPNQYVGFILRNPGPRGIYMVRFWPPGETSVSKMTNVFVAISSGRVMRTQSPQKFTAQSVLQADFAANIHSGAILGFSGRVVMFIAGLCFPVLFVTGLVMWVLGRRRTTT